MRVPLIKPDLPRFEDVSGAFREILENGRITNFGRYVTELETEVSRYLNVDVATVSSGTMALLFTLQALGLRPGKKVILPSFTFMATAQAVLYAGGIPLFAEIENDLTISPADVDELLQQNDDVDIVVGVHMYGLPCRTSELEAVVRKWSERRSRKIAVVYDAAHAFGSAVGPRKVGTFGEAEVFSLSVTKAFVTVEGGLVSSANSELIARIRKMRNYGIETNYDAWYPGLNGKMSEFHAIVGLANFRRIDDSLDQRQQKARRYADRIERDNDLTVIGFAPDIRHTFKDFTVLLPSALKPVRDEIIEVLRAAGVETRAYFYPPVHEQKYFRRFATRTLTRTEDLSRRVVTLPFFTSITESEMDFVADTLRATVRDLTPAAV